MPYNKAEAQASIEVVAVVPPEWWILAMIGGTAALTLIVGAIANVEARKS